MLHGKKHGELPALARAAANIATARELKALGRKGKLSQYKEYLWRTKEADYLMFGTADQQTEHAAAKLSYGIVEFYSEGKIVERVLEKELEAAALGLCHGDRGLMGHFKTLGRHRGRTYKQTMTRKEREREARKTAREEIAPLLQEIFGPDVIAEMDIKRIFVRPGVPKKTPSAYYMPNEDITKDHIALEMNALPAKRPDKRVWTTTHELGHMAHYHEKYRQLREKYGPVKKLGRAPEWKYAVYDAKSGTAYTEMFTDLLTTYVLTELAIRPMPGPDKNILGGLPDENARLAYTRYWNRQMRRKKRTRRRALKEYIDTIRDVAFENLSSVALRTQDALEREATQRYSGLDKDKLVSQKECRLWSYPVAKRYMDGKIKKAEMLDEIRRLSRLDYCYEMAGELVGLMGKYSSAK